MREIILPKSKTDTGGESSWEKVVIPDSISQKEELKLYPDFINKLSEKIKDLEVGLIDARREIKSYDEKLREQSSKNIEIIGIFSAILALLIIDVSIIKSATTFLSAILLITSLAVVLSIFAILIHLLFTPDDKKKISSNNLWWPIAILVLLNIIGIMSEIFKWSWSY